MLCRSDGANFHESTNTLAEIIAVKYNNNNILLSPSIPFHPLGCTPSYFWEISLPFKSTTFIRMKTPTLWYKLPLRFWVSG